MNSFGSVLFGISNSSPFDSNAGSQILLGSTQLYDLPAYADGEIARALDLENGVPVDGSTFMLFSEKHKFDCLVWISITIRTSNKDIIPLIPAYGTIQIDDDEISFDRAGIKSTEIPF